MDLTTLIYVCIIRVKGNNRERARHSMTTYPRLPEELDLRKKLLAADIKAIRKEFQERGPYHNKSEITRRWRLGLSWNSERKVMLELAWRYSVSYHTIYYWVKDSYRAWKREQNAKAHSKENMADYVEHRATEIKRRVERWRRYSPQWEWNARMSAKNEKRSKRKTSLGKPL